MTKKTTKSNNKTPDAPPAQPDQMAPHSVEAEEAVLGSILLNPDALPDVSFLSTDDLFIVRNGYVWDALTRLDERNEQIDYITVIEELRQQGHLEEVGGAAYITYLINHTPSSIYAETYGHIVERAAIRRRMLDAASKIARLAHEESADINDVIEQSEIALSSATDKTQSGDTLSDISATALDYLDSLENDTPRQPTGFIDLDNLIGGIADGHMFIVAGRPGMGKTSWLLALLLNAARRLKKQHTDKDGRYRGKYILLATVEMSRHEVLERLVSMITGISVKVLQKRNLTDEQTANVFKAIGDLSELPIVLESDPALTITKLRKSIRRVKRQYGPLAMVQVDYLQKMTVSPEERREYGVKTDEAEVAYIGGNLSKLGKLYNVPMVVAAQLNRAVEGRRNKRPQMADLRGSGRLEQDADEIMFLYRDEFYNTSTLTPAQAEGIISKNRHGPTGTVKFYFDAERTRFDNLSEREIDVKPGGKW